MSLGDLKQLNKQLKTEPQDPIDPSSTTELAKQGRKMDGIVSQREIEIDYNSTVQDNFLVGGILLDSPSDPSDIPPLILDDDVIAPLDINLLIDASTLRDAGEPLSAQEFSQIAFKFSQDSALEAAPESFGRLMFVADYTSRLIRSAMAVSGASSATERFGDIRKSHGFWSAMTDFMGTMAQLRSDPLAVTRKLAPRALEQAEQIPDILTKPSTPTETLPGIGKSMTQLGAPEELEWVYEVVGEVMVEGKVTGALKRAGKFGMAKLAKETIASGDDIAKKGGIKRLLGFMTDEEISALAEARRFKKVGKLGSRPAQKNIDEAVSKTFKYIEETKDARLTKQKAIKIKRQAGAARMHDVQGQGYGRGYSQRLKKAGSIAKTKSSYVPFLEASPDAVDDFVTMQRTIDNFDFGGSKIYTVGDAQDALAKLYERGELLTAGDVEHLRDVFGNDFANSLTKFIDKPTGLAGKALEVGAGTMKGLSATARTLMTTGELSFLLRQGNYRAWTRPSDAIRSFAVAARSLASPRYAKYWDEAMRGSAKGRDAVEKGLFLGRFDDGVKMTAREEMFSAEFVRRVPILGNAVARFEKGYVVGLNQLRIDWFTEGMDIINKSGKGGDEALTRSWSNYVNNMTGRADLDAMINAGLGPKADKIMEGMASTAKNVMFAPRFAASKWNRHLKAAEVIFGDATPAGLRRMVVTDTMVKWRRYERLAHYATQNGYEIENDPRSSDFLKIKRGNTRFDVLGGDAQLSVLIARLATGETKDTTTGEVKESIGVKLIQGHAAGKLNPAISVFYDKFVAQETFGGKDMDDPKVLRNLIISKFVPLYIQDVKDKIINGYEEEGLTVAESLEGSVSTVAMGFVGAGIQTYPPSARKKIELLYNDSANKLFSKDWPDLTLTEKQDAMFEAEMDHDEEIAGLKSEAGMNRLSPGGAAKIQQARNRSFRMIRDGLGDDFKLFKDSTVSPGTISIDLGDVRLSNAQHKEMHSLYVKFIKEELAKYPDIKKMEADDPNRRIWLQDILDIAKDSAEDELFFREPVEYKKE